MRTTFLILSSAILVATSLVGVALCQDSKKPEGAGGMPSPQASPHHAHLKMREGVWEGTIKMTMAGMPPSESKGIETDTMMAGLWLVNDVKSDMGGMPFLGHGITGFDTAKNKYVSVWVDSYSADFSHGEGTCDGSGKVLTTTWEGPDPSGKILKWRQTDEMKDKDTRVLTFYMPGPDGKESADIVISQKRKK